MFIWPLYFVVVHWLNIEQKPETVSIKNMVPADLCSLALQLSSGTIDLNVSTGQPSSPVPPSHPHLKQSNCLTLGFWIIWWRGYVNGTQTSTRSIPDGHIFICFCSAFFFFFFFERNSRRGSQFFKQIFPCSLHCPSGQGHYLSSWVTQAFCTACGDRPWDHPVQPSLVD